MSRLREIEISYHDGFTKLLVKFYAVIKPECIEVKCAWFDPRNQEPHCTFRLASDWHSWTDLDRELQNLDEFYSTNMSDLNDVSITVRKGNKSYIRRFYGLGAPLYGEYPGLEEKLYTLDLFIHQISDRIHRIAAPPIQKQTNKRRGFF